MLRRVVQSTLRRGGLALVKTAHHPDVAGFLVSRQVDLVVDVGANVGQFAHGLRTAGYGGRIRSFEPVSAVFLRLQEAAAPDPLWTVTHTAIGAVPGEATINIADNSVFSSIKSVTATAAWFDARSAAVACETVPVQTLDALLADDPARSVFLKIDTQGYEREVLGGAAALLRRVAGIQLELPIAHLYHDVWSFTEAVDHLGSLGFVPAQFRQVNPMPDDEMSAIEFDCVFRRT